MCKWDCYNTFFSSAFLQIRFIHPPLADPSLLSGTASQLLVLHMSLHYLATASNLSMPCLQNIYPFLQCMYLAPADVMMWFITAYFIPKSTVKCMLVAGVACPTADAGMLWGADPSCWVPFAVGHEVEGEEHREAGSIRNHRPRWRQRGVFGHLETNL